MRTGFFWDEHTFWHAGGDFAFTLPLGGLVQPLAAGGLPENPETKRRLKNLMDVTGLIHELDVRSAASASRDDLLRVHPGSYLDAFKELSDNGGGQLGLRTPFAQGGYEIAALSAGLSVAAVEAVLRGEVDNAYALSRPPGHHCLPDFPNGFCLMANIAIAIEAAKAKGLAGRVAVLDWDVHHGNGTEAIYYERDDVLTVSIHQETNYPTDTGYVSDRGKDKGLGYNINIPLLPGAGHDAYMHAMARIALPAIRAFAPDIIIVACGYDAAAIDPLSRMSATVQTFMDMTQSVMDLAAEICNNKLVLVHEGGYSEVYVPFCGHSVIQTLAASNTNAPDPFKDTFEARQPNDRFAAFLRGEIDEIANELGL